MSAPSVVVPTLEAQVPKLPPPTEENPNGVVRVRRGKRTTASSGSTATSSAPQIGDQGLPSLGYAGGKQLLGM